MKNRKTSPRSAVAHNPSAQGWLRAAYRWRCEVERLKRLPSSALRQMRHAGRRLAVFPQERNTAVLDLPEADVAGPDFQHKIQELSSNDHPLPRR